MAERLVTVLRIANTQCDLVEHLKSEVMNLQSNLIAKQKRVIDLQSELINKKDKNLHGLKDAVVSSIGGSVQTQLIIIGSCINFSDKVR